MSSDKEILALEDKRYAAMCGGDFAALEAMLHDELLYTHSSGLTDTKATWLASLRSGRTKYKSAACSDRKVRLAGDTALVTGRAAIEAARTVFSTGGPEASLEAVAKTAGVGIGTLYRHFPTREALFDAVYRREAQQLAALAERLQTEASPVEALRQWMHSLVKFVATKKGMSAALALVVSKDSDLFSYSSDLLMRSAGGLLDRAMAAGEIRNDIGPDDLIRTLAGMCYTHDQPGWQKSVLRLVDIFIDGLRNRRAKR